MLDGDMPDRKKKCSKKERWEFRGVAGGGALLESGREA